MQNQPWSVLLPLILVWLVSTLAGISFLRSALTNPPRPDARGWKKLIQQARFRLALAAGIGLLLWVLSGVVWILFNQVSS
ncbi:MAG TPA: hypothetical protein VGK00_14555 [Anaerolineales bacterium]|jgi:hypothetical protein